MTPFLDLTILCHLAARPHATAAEVRARLVSLESRRLVAGRHDARFVSPARAFTITSERRRKVAP